MSYDFSNCKKELTETSDWLASELSGIRTGRATPALVEKIGVESYGARTPINGLASITVEDARTLRVAPWDKSLVAAVQTAIEKENLGVSVAADENGLRVAFPQLTVENRAVLAKLVNERIERARVTVRKCREEVLNDLSKKEKDGEISEDDKFRAKDEMQKLVDATMKGFDEMKDKKLTEIAG